MAKPDRKEINITEKTQVLWKDMNHYEEQFRYRGVYSDYYRGKIKTMIRDAEKVTKKTRSKLPNFEEVLKKLKNKLV